MEFCLYSIRNLLNGKGYIGQTTQKPALRWKSHVNGTGQVVHFAIKKYGSQNFAFEPMMTFGTQADLDAAEIYMIKVCGTQVPFGYNVEIGGSNPPLSEASRKKISDAQRRLFREQPERRKWVGDRFRGKKLSPEQVKNMAAGHLGIRLSDEARAKIAASATERQNRPEVRAAISVRTRGRVVSTETRKKLSILNRAASRSRRWAAILTQIKNDILSGKIPKRREHW